MRYSIIVFVSICILTTSCGKPNIIDEPLTETSPGVKVIDKTITNSMYFKVGSYWIYESDKGLIDSMWIDSKTSIGIDRDNKSQTFYTYLFSSISNNSLVLGVQFWNPNQPDTQIRISIGSWSGNTSGGGGNISGLINADIFKQGTGSTNTCKTCTGDTAILMPSYSVGNKTYTNVWRFLLKSKDKPCIENQDCGNYFMAENIGLIKKFVYVGGAPNEFKLIRYHIVK